MSNINSTIILSLVSLILIVFFLNYQEQFTNFFTTSVLAINSNSEPNIVRDEDGYITEDISEKEVMETVPDELQTEVEVLVDEILEGLNKKYNKKIIRVNIERVQKTYNEGKNNYSVYVFVLNYKKESHSKLLLEFTLDDKNFISVSRIEILGSRQSLLTVRGGISSRDTLNLKQQVDMDKVSGTIDTPLESSRFDIAETSNKMVDRNSWILNKEREAMGNVETFPSRKMSTEWDMNGVNFVDKTDAPELGGVNYGNRKFTHVPNFHAQNFTVCFGEYLWLFDKERDVASQPIGVG
jgi:hypothetical protein